jgi:hypothetical protein
MSKSKGDEKLSGMIGVRLTPQEKAAFERAAARRRMSCSGFLRWVGLDALAEAGELPAGQQEPSKA